LLPWFLKQWCYVDDMKRLAGKRAVVTQANDFMGPAVCELFAAEGAAITADASDLTRSDAADGLIAGAGHIDILIVNLMERNRRNPVVDTGESEWQAMFDMMVHPTHRLVRAVLPQMLARRAGKIVVMGSANGLRGTSVRAAYSAARGAQLAYVRNAGIEVAGQGVNINAIAQNWVSNPTSYTPDIINAADFADRLKDVPIGRVAQGWESAALALFLASAESDFLCGQTIAFSGGWVT
jgi:2-keto-3-deoxy-L-fuconate dehydrogenase